LHAFGEQVTFHLVGAQTGGKFDGDYSTRWRTTVHLHLNEDELFVAREGTVAFFSDGQWHDLGPGGVAFISRESVHTFRNTGDAPSRMLIETSPVGFENVFRALRAGICGARGPDMQRIIGIAVEHGIHFLKS